MGLIIQPATPGEWAPLQRDISQLQLLYNLWKSPHIWGKAASPTMLPKEPNHAEISYSAPRIIP